MHHQWECLDLDVVFLVLDKLLEPIDRVSFGVVCKEWGRLSRAYKRWCERKVLPMLLVPSDYDESRQEWRYGKKNRRPKHQGLLYSILERRIYSHVQSLLLPSVSKPRRGCSRYYRGCGHGWVAMIDMDEFRREVIITLVNPFTTAMLQRFPPLEIYGWGIPKVILSEDPTLNQDNYVVVALSDHDSLDFIKGRQDWYHIECKPYLAEFEHCKFTDAIFYRGQIYMADNCCGIIAVFDYKSKQQMYLEKLCTPFQNLSQRAERAYLVESIKGDLLYILRFTTLKSLDEGHVTENFRVYKMVLNGSIVEHVEIKSIGDEALFVGDSHSISLLASSSSGSCQPNSIYFTDDSINFCLYLDNYGGLQVLDKNIEVKVDMGIFHLEDGTISQYYPKYSFDSKLLPPAFWIIPPAV
ncbi:uncharacterized protein LOC112176376 [Rosa chinensis]|uniref:uncharacterized protein LOC112176376 n=1 Tax=Rosa chinensis TaxID=74649 RepID=UPI001AD900C7|nr:uncharacterized protein LOC112176376 [Rosa chinensis]